ncbi:SAM-dependent methyltransferase [Mycobacterium sp. LTG2003]
MTLTSPRWYQWHAQYDELHSPDSDRLEVVQELLFAAMDRAPAGSLTAVSACAGQARDLLPVLIHHPRGPDVRARMVELDPLNASFLTSALGSTNLGGVEVVIADAGTTDAYIGAVPADLVLLCGVFANIDLADAQRTIDTATALCRPGGTVVWSSYGPRLAFADDVVALFEDGAFERTALHRSAEREFVVAAHRYVGPQRRLPARHRFFDFSD